MTFEQLEQELRSILKDTDQPAFEAREILLELCGMTIAQMILKGAEQVDTPVIERARAWARRRGEGYPLAYLSGKKGFYKHIFEVSPGVLIPRPETEHVLEVARARARRMENFADLGCGSGCMGLSLLAELPQANLFSVDISVTAIEVTKRNASAMGLLNRVQTLAMPVESWQPTLALDLVVANPPYIAEGDPQVQKSVHEFEPHAALYSGVDGLEAIRSWVSWARQHLRPGGVMVLEIGSGQSAAVREIMAAHEFREIQVHPDLAGHDRVVSGILEGG